MMISPSKVGGFKLPRLHLKEEVFKISPEVKRIFGEVQDLDDTFGMVPVSVSITKSRNSNFLIQSKTFESPRLFDTELGEEDRISIELEYVKSERTKLLKALKIFKKNEDMGGGETQKADIEQIIKEVEIKKLKLNELREQVKVKQTELEKLKVASYECKRMMVSCQEGEIEYISQLNEDLNNLEQSIVETEAKNRLYSLLSERTREDHMAMEKKVRELREMKKLCLDDLACLTNNYRDLYSLKDNAEKKYAELNKIYEEIGKDWKKNVKERRKEVKALKQRQENAKEKEKKRNLRKQEKEKAEREIIAKAEKESQDYENKIWLLIPRIEAMENIWKKLKFVSGASNTEDIIAYWKGLKEKESKIKEYVSYSEKYEERAKKILEKLMEEESLVLEKKAKNYLNSESENVLSDKITKFFSETDILSNNERSIKFHKYKTFCISIEQGIRPLLKKMMAVLEEISSANLDTIAEKKERDSPKHMKISKVSKQSRLNKSKNPIKNDKNIDEDKKTYSIVEEQYDNLFVQTEKTVNNLMSKLSRLIKSISQIKKIKEAQMQKNNELGDVINTNEDFKGDLILFKGLRRQTWTGLTWSPISFKENLLKSSVMFYNSDKSSKEKKKKAKSSLSKILGLVNEDTYSRDPKSKAGYISDDSINSDDGIIDRDYLKHRSLKLVMRHTKVKEKRHDD